MRRALVLLALTALAVPATAFAGGWAIVQLSSTPKGVHAGTPWLVDVTVLQHGQTPLAGVKPTVTIRRAAKALVFKARPMGDGARSARHNGQAGRLSHCVVATDDPKRGTA